MRLRNPFKLTPPRCPRHGVEMCYLDFGMYGGEYECSECEAEKRLRDWAREQTAGLT